MWFAVLFCKHGVRCWGLHICQSWECWISTKHKTSRTPAPQQSIGVVGRLPVELWGQFQSNSSFPLDFGLGRLSKKKNCKILDICQISVTLPTLYPDMDIKKFGHIFYTLTYLPIKKIWTNLEKSWYSYKAFRLFENLNI